MLGDGLWDRWAQFVMTDRLSKVASLASYLVLLDRETELNCLEDECRLQGTRDLQVVSR